ncbi:Capsular polysaccharide biosynthesis protein [Marinobacter nitratireducens]|uniref:Capsular polysaccharide biosynthesis protein n=1 Tax=Marinobacter nitratireducens TaxID=1137280 RepID=A0A072N2D3_9GAMM|nr:undecaprenyl-phosphate glucose phosphotransferase [Marinobacter nitratireducens]KEF31631.1 Capsular polysaccharide biosynthesis protein [Marinobacter nitratireducens]
MNDFLRVPPVSNPEARVRLVKRVHESPLSPRTSGSVKLTFWIQWALASLVQGAVLAAFALDKSGEVASHYRILMVMASFIAVPLCVLFRTYSLQNGYLVGVARIGATWATLVAILAFVAFATKTSELFSREVILQWIGGSYILQALMFLPLHRIMKNRDIGLVSRKPSLVVGSGDLALDLAIKLRYERHEDLLGVVALDDDDPDNVVEAAAYFPTLGVVSQLRTILDENDVGRVYIALPAKETDQIEGLYVDLLDQNVDVVWVPDFANLKLLNHSIQNLGGMPAIHLNESPLTSYPGSALMKSLMDSTLALLGVIALSPILLACAVAVKFSSPGPVLFRQKRHGWNGNIIEVLKFRSMKVHSDTQVKQAQKEDPRVTRVGRFLRRSSLDELPQLFNVIKGDMSLVGPRPHAVAHNDYYSDKIIAYMARHRIKPGITGLAQISGYRGETDTLDKMQKRVELDLDYINHWSLWLDVKILIKTPLSLFSRDIY